MADKTLKSDEEVRAALSDAIAVSALAMALDNLDDAIVSEALRNYGFALNAAEVNWSVSEHDPLYWLEVSLPIEQGTAALQQWGDSEDPNGGNQFAVTYNQGDLDARFALLTQSSHTATLFKMFFQ